MKEFLLWVWQLPQNLVGFILSRFCEYRRTVGKVKIYTKDKFFNSGVSLGNYVILQKNLYYITFNVRHELGHSKQSLYFGPLYFVLVGLPSLARNLWSRVFHKNWAYAEQCYWYYTGYPELWANKLGNKIDL